MFFFFSPWKIKVECTSLSKLKHVSLWNTNIVWFIHFAMASGSKASIVYSVQGKGKSLTPIFFLQD